MKLFLPSCTMFFYYYIYIYIIFFTTPMLKTIGYTESNITLFMSIGLVLMIISFLINGFLTDRYITNIKLTFIYLSISIPVLLVFTFAIVPVFKLVAYFLLWFLFMPLNSMIDGISLSVIQDKYYSKVRAFGSLGAAVGMLLNPVVENQAIKSGMNLLFFILLLFLLFKLSKSISIKYAKNESYFKQYFEVLKNKNLILILIIVFCCYGTLSADDATQIIYYTDYAKLSKLTIGLLGFFSILIEAILMYFFLKFYKIKNIKILLYLCNSILLVIYLSKVYFYEVKLIVIISTICIGVFVGIFLPLIISQISSFINNGMINSVLSLLQISIKLGAVFFSFMTSIFLTFNNQLPEIYLFYACVLCIPYLLIFKLKT